MAKTHFSPGKIKKIVQGKVQYVILDGALEVYSCKDFFQTIHVLDSLQRSNTEKEYKFIVREL